VHFSVFLLRTPTNPFFAISGVKISGCTCTRQP
jgi:hypothetical protein